MPLNGYADSLEKLLRDVAHGQHHFHELLEQLVAVQSASLDSRILEVDVGQPGTTTSNAGFRSQTNDVEIIDGLLVVLPVGTSTASFTLGELPPIPIQNTTLLLSPLSIPVRSKTRSLTYSPANATLGSLVILWGRAAPAMVPGVLHP